MRDQLVTGRDDETTVPRVPRWRMWASQLTFTGLGVLLVEAVLWWFR